MCTPGVFNAHPILVVLTNAEEDDDNETPLIESLWIEWHECEELVGNWALSQL